MRGNTSNQQEQLKHELAKLARARQAEQRWTDADTHIWGMFACAGLVAVAYVSYVALEPGAAGTAVVIAMSCAAIAGVTIYRGRHRRAFIHLHVTKGMDRAAAARLYDERYNSD
jgi:ABC-type transport system involved in cytochrome bd biosynthesis fused ATPase/permease subunit